MNYEPKHIIKKVLSIKFLEEIQLWKVVVEIENNWTKNLFFDYKEETELIKPGVKV